MTYSKAAKTALKKTHQSHLLVSLSHRLEVARESNNPSLIAALEHEYEQLNSFTQPTSLESWFQKQWTQFATTLSDWSTVHIEKGVDEAGQQYWYAYNPQAQQAFSTHSETEMHQWIKKTYWEK